jgi:hypothetical protein
MARTLEQILAEAEARPNPAGGNGILYRSDVIEALQGLVEPQRSTTFEELIDNAHFMTPQDKAKVKGDYLSY